MEAFREFSNDDPIGQCFRAELNYYGITQGSCRPGETGPADGKPINLPSEGEKSGPRRFMIPFFQSQTPGNADLPPLTIDQGPVGKGSEGEK